MEDTPNEEIIKIACPVCTQKTFAFSRNILDKSEIRFSCPSCASPVFISLDKDKKTIEVDA